MNWVTIFDDEVIINFDAKCVDCKYFNVKGDNICNHFNFNNCKHGELWWLKQVLV